jgi:hypothetical protein
MTVTARIKNHLTGELKRETFNNVTEVHYAYPRMGGDPRKRVAFESDVHGTGATYAVDGGDILEVIEFEVRTATTKAEEF